jgi:uncharacterized protein (TIGR00255 family)
MTAFGSGVCEDSGLTVTAEVKTLNSMFVEVNVMLPRGMMSAETEVIKLVKSKLKRGKVDVSIDLRRLSDSSNLPTLDVDAVKHYSKLFDELHDVMQDSMTSSFGSLRDPSANEMFKLEGVLTTKKKTGDASEEELSTLKKAVSLALDKVISTREVEGQSLKVAFEELIADLRARREEVVAALPEIKNIIQDNYKKRLDKVVTDLNDRGFKADMPADERILSELAVLIDKADIEEELTRLNTHFEAFDELLEKGDAMGRKLDFLCQELHREVNTISSKLHQSSVAKIVLDMKQTVEKIRQQVQNIE